MISDCIISDSIQKSQEELEKIINECRDQLTEEKRRARESNIVNLTSKGFRIEIFILLVFY